MPKRVVEDDEMPRRRRGAKAVAIDADDERGFAMRVLMHSPKDLVAGALAVAAICAIVANALFLQAGRHPSPMFGTVVTLPAHTAVSPLPRPRPVELAARPVEAVPEEKAVEVKPVETRNVDPKAGDKSGDPMTNLVVKSTSAAPAATSSVAKPTAVVPSNVPRPPGSIPTSARHESAQAAGARRIAAVQRALTEYGYGQLKATGAVGADTQNAITKFEKERKLPVTGQMSDRLVRELTTVTGRPIE